MGVNIRYHLDLCMTGIALNGFHIAAVQLRLVSDTGMSETMKQLSSVPSPQSAYLKQVNRLLNQLALEEAESQLKCYQLVTEKVFQFFDVSLSLYQHFRYGFQ